MTVLECVYICVCVRVYLGACACKSSYNKTIVGAFADDRTHYSSNSQQDEIVDSHFQ